MRRAVARGRVFPQKFSTDRRYGRLSLKAVALFPLMWVNADDQGRLSGDSEEIKYAVCPNIDHITKADIPDLLKELVNNKLILHYQASNTYVVQMLDWWTESKQQWLWPSDYPAPEGWQDHLRYKKDAKTVITLNWPVSGESSGETLGNSQVNIVDPTVEASGENSGEHSGESHEISPLTIPLLEKEKGDRRGKWRGRGSSPEDSAEEPTLTSSSGEKKPSPSPTNSSTDIHEILDALLGSFKLEFGRVPAGFPDKIIPREPTARERAQIRDFAAELAGVPGGCPLNYIKEAFREAARQGKMKISYVRAIILDWMGIERERPP